MVQDATRPKWTPLVAGRTPLSADELNGIASAVLRLVQFSASAPIYIRRDSSGYMIGIHPEGPAVKTVSAFVTANTLIPGHMNRWTYSVIEAEWQSSASVWNIKPGGVDEVDTAVNAAEAFNNGVDLEQLGVDMSRPTLENFTVQPIQNMPVVLLREIPRKAETGPFPLDVKWWFFAANAIDGDCPVPLGGAAADSSMSASWGLEIINRVLNLRVGAGLRLNGSTKTIDASVAQPLGTHPTTKALILDARAKGDLFVGKKVHESDRLTVGSDGQQPYADSTADLGVSWQTPFPSRITLLAVDTPISV